MDIKILDKRSGLAMAHADIAMGKNIMVFGRTSNDTRNYVCTPDLLAEHSITSEVDKVITFSTGATMRMMAYRSGHRGFRVDSVYMISRYKLSVYGIEDRGTCATGDVVVMGNPYRYMY